MEILNTVEIYETFNNTIYTFLIVFSILVFVTIMGIAVKSFGNAPGPIIISLILALILPGQVGFKVYKWFQRDHFLGNQYEVIIEEDTPFWDILKDYEIKSIDGKIVTLFKEVK